MDGKAAGRDQKGAQMNSQIQTWRQCIDIADGDPMYRDGVRSYKIIPCLMNEGSFTPSIKPAVQKIDFS